MICRQGLARQASKAATYFAVSLCAFGATNAHALLLGIDFQTNYSAQSLGSVPGLPTLYGGLTFLPSDPNKLLIGGNANTASGRLYTIDVVRDGDNRVTGFSGTATQYGVLGAYNDGGVTFGPDGVLFTARWPVHQLGQTKPGSTAEDRIDNMSDIGVPGNNSISAVGFVPSGFAGEGQMKVVTWSTGTWCSVPYSPDGSGTFNLDTATCAFNLPGGPEGFVYVSSANESFDFDSLLVSDYSSNRVSAYEIDANGDPIVSTRRDFLTGLTGAEGATFDPLTGDFFFSTFGGANQLVRVSGFLAPNPPPPPPGLVPEPGTLGLLMAALGIGAMVRRRRTH